MKVVADTNVLISALLWTGLPHRLLTSAEAGRITLYTSPALLDELKGVLARPKFMPRLQACRVTADELIARYFELAHVLTPPSIASVIPEDPTDDVVLACAIAAQARYLVTGDRHLLRLNAYQMVQIVSPRTLVATILR